MNCRTIRKQFDERLDGRLSEPARQQFEAHLAVCPACRQEWVEYAHAWEALTQLGPVTPSVGFVERTLRRLDEVPDRQVWPVLTRWLAYGTALVVLGLGSGLLWRQHTEQRRAALYAEIQGKDYLEDFDVIVSLDRLPAKEDEL